MAKFYIVLNGDETGVYDSWKECESKIKGYSGAKYKSFKNIEALENEPDKEYISFYNSFKSLNICSSKKVIDPFKDMSKEQLKAGIEAGTPDRESIWKDSISVDGACQGNPGLGAYQCVDVSTDENIFIVTGFENTTNNIMEFLALVEALKYSLKLQIKDRKYIYSDSITAMAWVRKKKANSSLKPMKGNEDSLLSVKKAEEWLKSETRLKEVEKLILKWDTKKWGEIPADFGNK